MKGDSLSGQGNRKPSSVTRLIEEWIEARFVGTGSYNEPFTVKDDMLAHGIQNDSINCGIYLQNTAAHCILGEPVLQSNGGGEERIRLFLKLTRYHFQVS